MANIFLYAENAHKTIGKNIYNFLKKNSYKVIYFKNEQNLENQLQNIDISIIVFSQKVNYSSELIELYDKLIDLQHPIILYVITDLEYSLSMKNFLDSNYWIDAYNVSSKEALDSLKMLIKELLTEKAGRAPEKSEKSIQKSNFTTKKAVIYGLIALFAILIGIFIYMQMPQNSVKNPTISSVDTNIDLTKSQILPKKDELFEKFLIGKWKLVNYYDNQVYTPKQLAYVKTQIEQLKKNFLLILNSDHTFKRYGFKPGGEEGYWEVDPQNKILYVWPPNAKSKDQLNIKELTNNSLKLVILTVDKQTNTQIITTLELKKVQ